MRRYVPKNFHLERSSRKVGGVGVKNRIFADGVIYDRKTMRCIGFVTDSEDIELLFKMGGYRLEHELRRYIAKEDWCHPPGRSLANLKRNSLGRFTKS